MHTTAWVEPVKGGIYRLGELLDFFFSSEELPHDTKVTHYLV